MKKFLCVILAIVMMLAMSVVAFADEQTMTITTEVPSASYTMTIPADATIDYNTQYKDIGSVQVVAVEGFSVGKNVQVTVTKEDFACDGVSTTIPFTIISTLDYDTYYFCTVLDKAESGTFLFKGTSEGKLRGSFDIYDAKGSTSGGYSPFAMGIFLNSSDWSKALGGTYTAKIHFSAEIVADES